MGSRNESDEPGAWPEPRQVRTYRQYNKQPLSGNSNNNYCDARDQWPASSVIPHATCTNV